MPLVKALLTPTGKRKIGWVFTHNGDNILILKKTPRAIAVTTKRHDFVSINKSADESEAGWSLEPRLLRAIEVYECNKVMILTPRPGLLYTTDAKNYFDGSKYVMVKKGEGQKVKCLPLEHFEVKRFGTKI